MSIWQEISFSYIFLLFLSMTSKSSSDSSTSDKAKLVWNSHIDAEEIFEVKMAELKAILIHKSIYHCVSERKSNKQQ